MTRDSNDWPIELVPVSELHLDLGNVRVRAATVDEPAVLNYLYASEDVLTLAHELLRDGFIDNELLLVCVEDGAYVVLEGNRRAAALKGLNVPSDVPSKEFQLDRLLERYAESSVVSSVRVMIAPSRAVTQPLLARLHTKNPKRAWPREQQAEFFHAQLNKKTTTEDLKRTYPAEAGNIVRFIRMAEIRHALLALKIHDPELRAFVHSGALGMTSFEYAYTKQLIQEVLGISFRPDGRIVRVGSKRNSDRVFLRLLEDFKIEAVNTRSPKLKAGTDEHSDYVDELWALRDDVRPISDDKRPVNANAEADAKSDKSNEEPAKREGSGSPTDDSGQGQSGPPAPDRNPRRGNTRNHLSTGAIKYALKSRGLEIRLEELRNINVLTLSTSGEN